MREVKQICTVVQNCPMIDEHTGKPNGQSVNIFIITALCTDGTMWEKCNSDPWRIITPIPVEFQN